MKLRDIGQVLLNSVAAPPRGKSYLASPPQILFIYTLDASGQRTKMVETFWFDTDEDPATPAVPKSTVFDWAYDSNSRLVSETIDEGNNGSADKATTYTWDATQQARKTVVASGAVAAVPTTDAGARNLAHYEYRMSYGRIVRRSKVLSDQWL